MLNRRNKEDAASVDGQTDRQTFFLIININGVVLCCVVLRSWRLSLRCDRLFCVAIVICTSATPSTPATCP